MFVGGFPQTDKGQLLHSKKNACQVKIMFGIPKGGWIESALHRSDLLSSYQRSPLLTLN